MDNVKEITIAEMIDILNHFDNKNIPIRIWIDEQNCDSPIERFYLEENSGYDGEKCLILI